MSDVILFANKNTRENVAFMVIAWNDFVINFIKDDRFLSFV